MQIRHRLTDSIKLGFERFASVFVREHERPILVFGNQKSGTSAISMLLGEATGLRTQMDIRGVWEPHLTPLLAGQTGLDEFVRRNAYAFSAPIVKEPGLTFVARALAAHFPKSPCIFIVRNPFQNVRSILNRLGLDGRIDEAGFDARSLPNATWRSIMTGADLGLEATDPITVQALRWVRAVAEYDAQPERFILMRYEDFLRDKETAITNLARRVGLEPAHSIAGSKDRQFQPRGKSGVDPAAFFGSRNHATIARVCGPAARRLGYDVAGT